MLITEHTSEIALARLATNAMPATLVDFAEQVAQDPRADSLNLDVLGSIDAEFLKLFTTALRDNTWDDCVAHFGECIDEPQALYAGPMRPSEKAEPGWGMFYATTNTSGMVVAQQISQQLDAIGDKLFGYPCDLRGRVVEFRDLQIASGPLVRADDAPIAIFTPFYLDGWKDSARQLDRRRTIMFVNVVIERFRAIAATIADRGVTIDGRSPRVASADDASLRRAVASWLTLHEAIHGSGPAPFFEPWSGKNAIDSYAVTEETRVDMTAFLAQPSLQAEDSHALARELILLERLLRSGRRCVVRRASGQRGNVDDNHGLVWLRALTANDALTVTPGGLDINWSAAVEAVSSLAAIIYEAEQSAAHSDDCSGALRVFGQRFEETFLSEGIGDRPTTDRLLQLGGGIPTAIKLTRPAFRSDGPRMAAVS
jgi:hypothetical protein